MFHYDIFRHIYFCTLLILTHPTPTLVASPGSHPSLLLPCPVCVYTRYIVKFRSSYDTKHVIVCSSTHCPLLFLFLPQSPSSTFTSFHRQTDRQVCILEKGIICPSEFDLFCLTWLWAPVLSIFQQMIKFNSFLQVTKAPLYICIPHFLCLSMFDRHLGHSWIFTSVSSTAISPVMSVFGICKLASHGYILEC